jgi:hypothetical protein
MAGVDFVFNCSLAEVKEYAQLNGASDDLALIPIETTGIEADATLRDYDDVSALLGGSSNEQTTIGRKSWASATITVDDTNNRTDIDLTDHTYTAPTGNAVGKFLWVYRPTGSGGADSTNIPLTAHAVSWTPDGNDTNIVVNAAGIFRASSAT